MGSGGSTLLLPVPDERLKKCIKILELSNIEIAEAFAKFCKYDKSRRGCLPLATVYKMLSERKSIFGDSVFELVGECIQESKLRNSPPFNYSQKLNRLWNS